MKYSLYPKGYIYKYIYINARARAYPPPYIYIYIHIFEGRLKISYADLNTLMECDQKRLIFQHVPPCSPHTSSIDIATLSYN